jgi:hypothetical protein
MGWWTRRIDDRTLYLSDEGLDLAADFLARLRTQYETSDLRRSPRLEEVLLTLQTVLAPEPSAYLADGPNLSIEIMTTAKKKRPASPAKPEVGDVIRVPLKRDLFAYVQLLEYVGKSGIVGILPRTSTSDLEIDSFATDKFVAQLRIEMTGVEWGHWQVVGRLPTKPQLAGKPLTTILPAFVAEFRIVEALRKAGVLRPNFFVFDDVRAKHPKLRAMTMEKLSATMRFLRNQGALTDAGLAEIPDGEVPDDFSMHSDLLTEQGRQFYYDVILDKDFEGDELYADTERKLEGLWREWRATEEGTSGMKLL